ncbi:MAG: TIGR02147 family protein [Fibrobacteria bacterium]|nr:TIGR02147 family protein [Fibrobacteria bacterium]
MALDIYEHDDFRKLLAHLWEEKLSRNRRYSTRAFARDAGLTNPGFLGDVIKGRRKLSQVAMEKMIAGFGLRPKEAEYFRLLVRFGQTRSLSEREDCYRQILTRRNRSTFTRMNPAHSRYYQDYRYPLLRAALQCLPSRSEPAEVGAFLDPPLPPHQVSKMIQDLVQWGLVRDDPHRGREVVDTFVEPPPHLGELVRNLNRTWIDHAGEAIGRFRPDQRHISSILLTVSESTQRQIRDKIDSFREEVFRLLKEDRSPDRVMQLSLQFFPRSRSNDPGRKA